MDVCASSLLSVQEDILDLLFSKTIHLNEAENLNPNSDVFTPHNKLEKVLLLLLLKRSTTVFGCSFHPLKAHRYVKVEQLRNISDDLVVATVKFNQYKLLFKLFESIVRFSNYNSKILVQYALILKKLGYFKIALEYFILLADILNKSYVHFSIVQMYFSHFYEYDNGIAWCHKIFQMKEAKEHDLIKAKCYLYLAIGYYLKYQTRTHVNNMCDLFKNSKNKRGKNRSSAESAKRKELFLSSATEENDNLLYWMEKIGKFTQECIVLTDKVNEESPCDSNVSEPLPNNEELSSSSCDTMYTKAVQSTNLLDVSKYFLNKALSFDKNNHVIFYYLALTSAENGNVSEAIGFIKRSLLCHSEHLPSLHLLVLLESTKDIDLAETLLKSIIQEYPDNTQLYMTLAHLKLSKEDYVQALTFAKEALSVWKCLYCDLNVNCDSSQRFRFDQNLKSDSESSTENGFRKILKNDTLKSNESYGETKSKGPKDKICEKTSSGVKSPISFSRRPSNKENDKRVSNKRRKIKSKNKFGSRIISDTLKVETYLNTLNGRIRRVKICHNELPKKQILLIDILCLFARIYMKLGFIEDFLQCLDQMFYICLCTQNSKASCQNLFVPDNWKDSLFNFGLMTDDDQSCLTLSAHFYEIYFHLGLYLFEKCDFLKAKFCFNNVLSVKAYHTESSYYLAFVEKELGQLKTALNRINFCLPINVNILLKSKLYILKAEICAILGQFEMSCICSDLALQHCTVPICSYDIIPPVFE